MSVSATVPLGTPLDTVLTREQERYYFASQWQLIWWRLRRHRFAMISLWFLLALYATIPFVEFLAPYELRSRHPAHIYSPPQRIRFFHEGRFVGPFVYGHLLTVNMQNLRREYREDRSRRYRVLFFAPGEPYRMWGLWRADRHLIGVEEGGVLSPSKTHVVVETLATSIPSGIELDISGVAIGEALRIADLPELEGVAYTEDPETVLMSVTAPAAEIEEEPEEVEGEEIEGEGEPVEGEEPGGESEEAAEGEEAPAAEEAAE